MRYVYKKVFLVIFVFLPLFIAFPITTLAGPSSPGFYITGSSISEGDSGTSTVTIQVLLSGSGAGSYSVDYTTSGGTATAGSDYVTTSGTFNFTNDGTQTFTVTVMGDTDHESDETFNIVLSNPVGASIVSGTYLVTIAADDFYLYQASDLLGQLNGGVPDYSTHDAGTSSTMFSFSTSASEIELDTVHHRLFVADTGNNRVLIFNLDSSNQLIDHTADFVLGQADFDSSTTHISANQQSLFSPQALAYDDVHNRLFVAEISSNRVVVFDTSSISDNMAWSYVLGQQNSTDGVISTDLDGLTSPNGLAYDSVNDRLFVSDGSGGTSRVLVYNTVSISDGEPAVLVLGQGGTDQSSLHYPKGLAYDETGKRLFVTDYSYSRILVFGADPLTITDNEDASAVLGQGLYDGSAASAPPTDASLYRAEGVEYDSENDRLFVSDLSNGRVLIFNTSIIVDGEAAVGLFGEEDYISTNLFNNVRNGTFNSAVGLAYDNENNYLYVLDSTMQRIQIFYFVRITNTSLASGTVGTAYSQTITTSGSQGTISFSIASGSLPSGLTLDPATDIISGTPTSAGSFTFTILATDTNATLIDGNYTNYKEFTITVASASGGGESGGGSGGGGAVLLRLIQQPINTSEGNTPSWKFTKDVTKLLYRDYDVFMLQKFINKKGFLVAKKGPGSLNNETYIFGPATRNALRKFQKVYGIKPATGWLGPKTRALVNSILEQ